MPKPDVYGYEMLINMSGCDISTFTRTSIRGYMKHLCKQIGMVRKRLHFWDYEGYPEEKAAAPPHLCGTTATQFIQTSNILIHTFDKLSGAMLTIFSCKKYDPEFVKKITMEWFGGSVCTSQFYERSLP